MNRAQKISILFLLTIFCAGISLACGGGGSSDTNTSTSPTSSVSASASTSPTPSASTLPTSTPDPVTYSIEDFEGHWKYAAPIGLGGGDVPDFDLYFNTDDSGVITPETPEIASYPLVTSGTIVLTNSSTGAYTLTVTVKNSEVDGDTASYTFGGLMAESKDSLSVTTSPGIEDVTMIEPLSDLIGEYSLEISEILGDSSEIFFLEINILALQADGEAILRDPESVKGYAPVIEGTWDVFRNEYVVAEFVITGLEEMSILVVLAVEEMVNAKTSLEFVLNGTFVAEEEVDGEIHEKQGFVKGYYLVESYANFAESSLYDLWSGYAEPEDAEDSSFQFRGLEISASTITLNGEIVSGSINVFNTVTGYFEVTVVFTDATSSTLIGFIGASGNNCFLLEFENASTANPPEESTALRLFRQLDSWETGGVEGFWSLSMIPGVTDQAPGAVILNAFVYEDQDGNYLVELIYEEATYQGSVIVTGDGQFSFLINIDVDQTEFYLNADMWIVATLGAGYVHTNTASCLFSISSSSYTDSGMVCGLVGRYDASGISSTYSDFAGTYTTDNDLLGNATFVWNPLTSEMTVLFSGAIGLLQPLGFSVTWTGSRDGFIAFTIDFPQDAYDQGLVETTFCFLPGAIGADYSISVFTDNVLISGVRD